MRSSREPKALTIQPRRCRSDQNMAEILSKRPQQNSFQVVHFTSARRFDDGQLLLVDRNMRAAENAHFSFSVITALRSVPQERRTATRVYPSCTKIEQEQGKDHCLSVISDRSRSLYSRL